MRPVPLEVLPDSQNAAAVRGAWRVDPQSKKISLIFTREANGTRNLWQATSSDESEWPLKALTNFAAPLWADEAQVSSDGRTIICVTNALGDNKSSQIARFHEKTGQLEALTQDAAPSHSPALSPDGKSLVFAREANKNSTLFLISLDDKIAPLIARRVIEGRRPAWLNSNTLLFSDARKNGLYRLEIPTDWPPLLPLKTKPQVIAFRSGEVTVVPDGSQLCLALDEERTGNPSRLFFMAPNGSGERALRNTDGAHSPRFAPDGTALLFDAPLTPNGPRTLWAMNLAPVVPTVEITGVSANKTGLNIIGTVFCEDSPQVAVKIEAGQGTAPEQWQTIASPKAPLQKESLAQWQPPAGAQGDWTVRLTANSPDGDAAQTSMTLSLPLAAGQTVTNTSPDVSIFVSPISGAAGIIGTHGIGSAVIPGEWVNGKFIPRGPKTFPEKNHITVPNPSLSNSGIINVTPPIPSPLRATPLAPLAPPVVAPIPAITPRASVKDDFGGPLQSLPLPALPPPPSVKGAPFIDVAPPVEASAPRANTPPIAPPIPTPTIGATNPLNLANPPVRRNVAPRAPFKTLGGPKEKTPAISVAKNEVPPVRKNSAKTPAKTATQPAVSKRSNGASQINLEVPEDLKSGEDSDATCLLRNTGKSVWSSSGDNPARLLVRWFDAKTGRRFRWEIKWLPADVPPGKSVPLLFALTPPRTGKLRLNLVVVRLAGGKYQPTSTNDDDDLDKLAEKNFSVTVE